MFIQYQFFMITIRKDKLLLLYIKLWMASMNNPMMIRTKNHNIRKVIIARFSERNNMMRINNLLVSIRVGLRNECTT